MSDKKVTIRIGSTADTSGIDRATGSLQTARGEADKFVEAIRAGVGIDIGGRIVQSIADIPRILQDAIGRGVEFNFAMGDAEIAISNVLAKFQGLSKEAAQREAGKAMQQIIDLEPKAAGGLQDLVGGFMATVASSQAAGISVSENIDLVGRFANAAANANLPVEQLAQEMRAILTGNITPDASLAKILEISSADIAAAKEAGNLYEYLVDKVGELGVAGDSAAVRMSTMQSSIDKALGEFAKPISDELFRSFEQLTAAVSDPAGRAELEKLGFEIASLVKGGAALVEWAIKNADTLTLVAKSAVAVGIAFAAIKVANIVMGLTGMVAGLVRSKLALDAETASLARNSAAQASNAASRRGGAAAGAGAGAARAGSNIGGAVSAGVGIGAVGYLALMDYAAGIDAQSAKSNELGQQISKLGMQYGAAIKGASSVAEREEIVSGITADILTLREQISDASEEDGAMISRSIGLLERMRTIAGNISDEKLNAAQADKEAAAAAAEQATKIAANADALAKYDAARAKEVGARQQSRFTDTLVSGAQSLADRGEDSTAIADQIAQLSKYLDTIPALTDPATNVDDKAARDAQRDDVESQIAALTAAEADRIATLADARKTADEEAKAARIKAIQEEIALTEAQGRRKLAQIEASGAQESKISEARKREEDAIAAKRLALENQIGSIQNESESAKAARLANYEASTISRAASLADTTRPDDTFDQGGRRGGKRIVGADGTVLRDASGTLAPGVERSRLGTLSTAIGSRLNRADTTELAGPLPVPQILPSGAANDPVAAGNTGTPSAAGGNAGATAAVDKAGGAVAAALKDIESTLKKTEGAATQTAGQVQSTASAITTALANITKQLNKLQSQVKNA